MMYAAGFIYIDLATYLFILIFYVNNIYSVIPKIIQVLEFENIMVRFEIHVYWDVCIEFWAVNYTITRPVLILRKVLMRSVKEKV